MRGTVGNRAAVFALETLGHPVWAVPTVILPWHPGHGPSTRIVPPPEQFLTALDELARSPWLGEVGAVLSGYLGDHRQAEAIVRLVDAARQRNPHCLYVCDPVIGDQGGAYVPGDTVAAVRDRLLPMADIATPNRFELEWLAGMGVDTNAAIVEAARQTAPPRLLVTSAHGRAPGETGNILVSASGALQANHRMHADPPNGLGDLTAAVFAARLLAGQPERHALETTTGAVAGILEGSLRDGADELALHTHAACLSDPGAAVSSLRLDAVGAV